MTHHRGHGSSTEAQKKTKKVFFCVSVAILWFCGVVWAQEGAVESRSAHESASLEEAEEHPHVARHGGFFGDAEDLFHYELVRESSEHLVLYVNDGQNQPLDVHALQGRWTLNPDEPAPTIDYFTPMDDGTAFVARLPDVSSTETLHILVEVLKGQQWVGMEFELPPTLGTSSRATPQASQLH